MLTSSAYHACDDTGDALTCGVCMLWMISGESTGEQRDSGVARSPSQAA
jgi:hypothetical protein